MAGMVKKWLYAGLFLAVFLLLLAGFFPLLVSEYFLPPVLARAGLTGYDFSLSRFSVYGCSLQISGRPQYPSPVVAGNVRIEWTPTGLLQRRIEKISSSGLQINLIDLPSQNTPSAVKPGLENVPAEQGHMPFVIDQLEIRNGALFFPAPGRIMHLPFSFSGHRVTGKHDQAGPSGGVNFQVRMDVAKQIVNAFLTFHPSEKRVSVSVDSDFDLASSVLLMPFSIEPVSELAGVARISIEAAAYIAPFSVESVEAAVVFDNLSISGSGFSAGTVESEPAKVAVSGSGAQFQVKGTGFHVADPIRSELDFDTHVSFVEKSLQWQGTFGLKPQAGYTLKDWFTVKDAAPVQIRYSGSAGDGKTSVRLATLWPEGSHKGASFVLQQEDGTATVGELDIDTRITYDKRHPELNTLTGMMSVSGRNITLNTPQGLVKVPKLSVKTEGTVMPSQDRPYFTARFNIEDASFEREQLHLQVQGIQVDLPVAWPAAEIDGEGNLQVKTVRLGGKDLGNFSGEIMQDVRDLKIDGLLHTPLFPDEKISVSGIVRLPDKNENIAEMSCSLQNGSIAVDNFVPFIPVLDGIEGAGKLDAQGNVAISPCGMSGQAEFSLNNGNVVLKDAETEIEDVRFSLRFPDLPSVSTSPMQQLSIGTLRKKKLVVNDLKALFEIESPRSLFIEKIAGRWSGGRVFTSSFRLHKDHDEFDIALFCDRLELSSILSQFGLAEAGGEGRLSGRVPLSYAGGRFFVDDGFLFSTPGEKGNLKIRQSKYLETTIPTEVPQFSPLHFAGAALADFEYNWAKLQIKSEEENLLLKLQVDGKPREILPFRFDTKNNVFVRLDAGSKGGIDQPIKLDVNFNVPVNEIFQYKDSLMPFFRKLN